ncbi:MAG: hypothetical protein QW594_03575 [Candidatus Woesearchaeota archaeon]
MPKKCILCDESASYKIRGTSDFYCFECAKESFSDLSLLEKVEEIKENAKQVEMILDDE